MNNKHNSFNQTIDTTAVYYRYNCSFGKTKSFRPRCRVKFGAQHTPVSHKHTIFHQNQHFSYPKRCTALRTALPEKSTLSHRFFVHASVHRWPGSAPSPRDERFSWVTLCLQCNFNSLFILWLTWKYKSIIIKIHFKRFDLIMHTS